MTEAPDVYPDFPDDDDPEAGDEGVEGVAREHVTGRRPARAMHTRRCVLDSLEGLDDRPVGEHAAAFERAHEELRAALEPERESA